jgi:serine/threonine-protein kinase
MAAVYLAHDERLDRRVAVKRMHSGGGDEMDARRFEREAKIGASLSHPNLVSIFDTQQDDESVLLVMEYVDGETLGDLLARGRVEPRRAVEVVRAVAEALDHAHANGIVHRDVKPGNVLLGKDGSVKLADLGIAKAVERTDITGTGTVLGTPAYMAPEQLEGRDVGPAVDIYALATLAFEMLTGQKARRGRTAVEIAHQVVNEGPPDACEVNPELPRRAGEALRGGMAKDRAERPASAVELAERLDQALGTAAPTMRAAPPTRPTERVRPVATPPAPPPRVSRPARRSAGTPRWVAAVLGLFALAIAVVVIGLAVGGGEDGAETADRGGDNPAKKQKQEKQDAAAAPAPTDPATDAAVPVPSGGPGDGPAARSLHSQGYAALQRGDYNSAIELNRRAIETFPAGTTYEDDINYAYALFSLGQALRLADRPEEAIPVLEERLEIPNQTPTVAAELEKAQAEAAQ